MFSSFCFFFLSSNSARCIRACLAPYAVLATQTASTLPPFLLPYVPPLLSPAEFSPFLPSSIAVEMCVHALLK